MRDEWEREYATENASNEFLSDYFDATILGDLYRQELSATQKTTHSKATAHAKSRQALQEKKESLRQARAADIAAGKLMRCECGSFIRPDYQTNHKKSGLHRKWMRATGQEPKPERKRPITRASKYYNANRVRILEKEKKKFECECGAHITRTSMYPHRRSARHALALAAKQAAEPAAAVHPHEDKKEEQ